MRKKAKFPAHSNLPMLTSVIQGPAVPIQKHDGRR